MTSNDPSLDPSEQSENRMVLAVPEAQVERLLAIHAARLDRLKRDTGTDPCAASTLDEIVAMANDGYARNMQKKLDRGIYTVSDNPQELRCTFYGAIHESWLSLPPFKQIHRARIQKQTRAALKDLGFDA